MFLQTSTVKEDRGKGAEGMPMRDYNDWLRHLNWIRSMLGGGGNGGKPQNSLSSDTGGYELGRQEARQ